MHYSALKIGLIILFLVNNSFVRVQPQKEVPYTLTIKSSAYLIEDGIRTMVVSVVFSNNTSDSLKFASWLCSKSTLFKTSDAAYRILPEECLRNLPITETLLAHKNVQFDFKVRCTPTGNENFKFKIGMNLIKDEMINRYSEAALDRVLNKHVKILENMTWSNEISWADK